MTCSDGGAVGVGVGSGAGIVVAASGACVAAGVATGALVDVDVATGALVAAGVATGALVAAGVAATVATVSIGVEVASSPLQPSSNATPTATTANLKPAPQIVMAGMIP